MAREPGYCRHKPTNQAYVNLGGQVIYLGAYGSSESKERYNRLKAEWLINRHAAKFQPKAIRNAGPCISAICNDYLDHAEKYYAGSSEYVNLELAIQPLSELYAESPANEFGIVQFRACREWWLKDPKRSRQYVNKQMKRLLRVLKWAVGEGMLPASIYDTLRYVPALMKGRTDAPETKPVKPVSRALVDATIKHMTTVQADMVRFQQLVGCRPGELCMITPSMVNRSEAVWLIELADHKTSYRGKSRTLYVGPQAQAILTKYLLRAANSACFSPIESEKQRRQAMHEARTTPMNEGNKPGSNIAKKPRKTPGDAYTTSSYAHAIKYACIRGKLESWSPNQLRHSVATDIRKQFGLEAAQVILGHSDANITQTYAERDSSKAIAVALAVG